MSTTLGEQPEWATRSYYSKTQIFYVYLKFLSNTSAFKNFVSDAVMTRPPPDLRASSGWGTHANRRRAGRGFPSGRYSCGRRQHFVRYHIARGNTVMRRSFRTISMFHPDIVTLSQELLTKQPMSTASILSIYYSISTRSLHLGQCG